VSEDRPEINWGQIAAGALAAVSSAVLLSTLGVAGTLVGAALGSVVASVAGTLYTRGLDAGREQVLASTDALRRVSRARARVDEAVSAVRHGDRRAESELARAEEALHDAEAALDETAEPPRTVTARTLPWRRIVPVAVGVFLVAIVTITAFELVSGRAVSNLTGGSDGERRTTVPGLEVGPRTNPRPTMTPTSTGTPTASASPTSAASPGESPTTADPSPTAIPSESPTSGTSEQPPTTVTPPATTPTVGESP